MEASGKTRQEVLTGAGAGAVGLGVGAVAVIGLGLLGNKAKPAAVGDVIPASYESGSLPVDDPESTTWRRPQRVIVPLQPQQVAPPILEEPSVSELVARALYNSSEVAMLLEWSDPSVDDLDGVHRYHDAIAIQLPVQAGDPPAITMGGPGAPVQILQWRATWQRDIDSPERTGVDQIFPNVIHDVMPDDILPEETASLYWVGRAAGNPLSQVTRSTPVEAIVAEGFGSTTHLPEQAPRGRGIHDGEGWKVTIGWDLAREGVGEPMTPGSIWPVAFALWRGDADNRGSRKHFAGWLGLELESS